MMQALLLVAMSAGEPAAVAANAPQRIEQLSWLEGCWESGSAARTVEEQWMTPRGRSMLGMSRTVKDGALVEYELVVIREVGAGLVYEAHPSGQAAATFPCKAVKDGEILFEDPEHDFPQRIGYRRDGADAVVAWIEGTRDGKERRIEFPYRRVACPGR